MVTVRVKLPPIGMPNHNGKVYSRDAVLKACAEKGIHVQGDETVEDIPAETLRRYNND